ncbi:hypothetical protein DUA64_06890 [Salmonella enterica subsp. enterica serovar Abony]|nr:hypothetical protein [Salmonella enterica subsp. enterica serovar Abony]EBY6398768.1 hypothetical protein [Salmonella enterica subsp. enterica serovar Abony]
MIVYSPQLWLYCLRNLNIMNRNGVTQDTLRLRWHSICLCQRLYVSRILTLSLFLILYAW